MEATELRIGNYVTSAHNWYGEEYIVVESIISDKINMNFIPYRIEDLNPIQLTEEWLIKLGFEKGGCEGLFWYKDELEFAGINYLDKEIPEYQFLNFSVSDERIIQIHYVHQLQNLYHALTYQELG